MLVKNTKLSVTGEGVFLLTPGERIATLRGWTPVYPEFPF